MTLLVAPTLGFPYIKVTDGGNCTWHLGLKDCETWFVSNDRGPDHQLNILRMLRVSLLISWKSASTS